MFAKARWGKSMSEKNEKISSIEKNTVSSKGQVKEYDIVRPVDRGGKVNVLFVGNSITRHAPAEEIGWPFDWGMSATKEENDYVHVAVSMLDKKYGKVNYCTACCGDWEREYFNDEKISRWAKAREFDADILVVRLGENIWGPLRENLDQVPLYPHLEKFIEFFKTKKDMKVVITDLFWAYEGIDKVLREIAEKKGYSFVHISDLGENDEYKSIGKFWHEGVAQHPNDLGMRVIAERIVEKL